MPRNREKYLAAKKRHYEKHKTKILAYQKKYKEDNPELIAGRQKKWRDSLSPEEKKAKKRAEYLKNQATYQAYRDKKQAALAALKPYGPPAPTLLQELGFFVPFKKLSREDQEKYKKEYLKRNPERKKKYAARSKLKYDPKKTAQNWKKFYEKNAAKLSASNKRKREENPEYYSQKNKEWRVKNADKILAARKRHYKKNVDKMRARSRDYAAAHPERKPLLNERAKRRFKARYYSDPGYKMLSRMRCRFYEVLRKKNHHHSETLKLNKVEIVAHIEKQFLPGMDWTNHGTIWHVDHIIPCNEFDFGDMDQARECFALPNLRPIWAKENLQKNATVIPELLIKHGLTMPKRKKVETEQFSLLP